MTATSLSRSAPTAIAMLLLGVGGTACRTEAPPAVRVVEIHDMAFDPAVLEARPGDTLVWVNRDIFPHTVTAADSSWSSPPLRQGERWRLVATKGSTGAYGCRFHPTMEGRIGLTTRQRERP